MQVSIPPVFTAAPRAQGTDLKSAAEELEVQFLAEMFKIAGLGKTPEGFGGGEGEEHFSSMLATEQARSVVKAGGIGLAEQIFKSLTEKANG